jgi:hypothetical protein
VPIFSEQLLVRSIIANSNDDTYITKGMQHIQGASHENRCHYKTASNKTKNRKWQPALLL